MIPVSVWWYVESPDGTELAEGPLEGEATFLEWWCRFGRTHGLNLIPMYLEYAGAMIWWSADDLKRLRQEVETLRSEWARDAAVTDLPPNPRNMSGQQLLVHLRERSKELLDAIDLAEQNGAALMYM